MAAREHDLELIGSIVGGAGSALVRVADPPTVAHAVADGLGARLVELDQLGPAIASAARATVTAADDERLEALAEQVRIAEQVVAATIAGSQARAAALGPGPGADAPVSPEAGASHPDPGAGPATDEARADRQAVRFALVILVAAQVGGFAVYAADGELFAALIPVVALAVVVAVVLAHRRPAPAVAEPIRQPPTDAEPVPAPDPVHVPPSAAVRAAQAHLRRQQAAWKVAWWEQGQPVPPASSWSGRRVEGATLVSVDAAGTLDEAAFASMTASLPAAVRVLVFSAASA